MQSLLSKFLSNSAVIVPAVFNAAPSDPLGDPAPVPPPAPSRPGRITCDACECQLAANGGVLTVSEKWKSLSKHQEKIEKLESELGASRAECADLKRQIPPSPAPTPSPVKRRGIVVE